MRVLVIGAYGFIGRAMVACLQERGHSVVGLGRSARLGRRLLPEVDWIERDLNAMTHADRWHGLLAGIDAVINASGALQDIAGDRLSRVQGDAIVALIDACVANNVMRFVQISAPGVTRSDATNFLRTKAMADDHLVASSLAWTILRPALVIGRDAFGGTALIRMLAASPIMLTVHGRQPVQCIARTTVAALAADGVEGRLGTGMDVDLAEDRPRALAEVVALHRRALGLPPAWIALDLPASLARPVGIVADALGLLGWRSPLRSTALAIVARGIVATPTSAGVLGRPLDPLPVILESLNLDQPDRWAARLALLLPLIVAGLAGLWIASGVAGLLETDAAAALIGGGTAGHFVVRGFACLDLLVGFALLWRPSSRSAAFAMAAMAGGYILGGSIIAPQLWIDPLMPLFKAVPALILALVAAALLEQR